MSYKIFQIKSHKYYDINGEKIMTQELTASQLLSKISACLMDSKTSRSLMSDASVLQKIANLIFEHQYGDQFSINYDKQSNKFILNVLD